jgi:hypothetical protein
MNVRWLILLSCLVQALPAGADKLYKWVDASGKVQYSDKPPPSAEAQRGVAELNQRGMVIRQSEGVLSPEEKARRDAELARQQAEARERAEQRRRDISLVNTFASTAEIDALRDRNIEQIQAAIQADDQRLEAAERRKAALQKQVDSFILRKKALPPDLQRQVDEAESERTRLAEQVQRRHHEIAQLRERAEADKRRLIELKGPSVNVSPGGKPGTAAKP